MIVSVTFRHDTENKRLRQRVNAECRSIVEDVPAVNRIQIVFSRQTHHAASSNLITCHISIHAQGKQHIDIYEHQANEYLAFDRALDRASSALSRIRNNGGVRFTTGQTNWSQPL